jgi:hypothetical protein
MNNITFLNFSHGVDSIDEAPIPTIKTLPDWYKKFPKYIENASEEHVTHSTVKNCIPFFDAMSSGYSMVTPCDIEFYIEDGLPKVIVHDEKYKDFVGIRQPIEHFFHPIECHTNHFDWEPKWSPTLPDGYSALYVTPLNRYDLPFITTSGIIDNDKMSVNGLLPFFLKKGFEKVFLPKGTPFVQIIPFKREDWSSNIIMLNDEDIDLRMDIALKKYRSVKAGGYKDTDWQRKTFS